MELYIVDANGRALGISEALRAAAQDPLLALELNRYNLEYNLPVLTLAGAPFTELEQTLIARLKHLNSVAADMDAAVVGIGILPTLTETDLGIQVMTPGARYEALTNVLLAMRGGAFDIDISGRDRYKTRRHDVTLEGACTSFQVHYGFPIEQFVDIWNAVTLITPLLLGVGCNSPLLLGHRLWHETRVPLFKQSTDGRRQEAAWHDLPRVELGYDWLRRSVHELFAQRVYLYPPLIPQCDGEDPLTEIAAGRLPGLHELNLHNGTVWHWNRPIYSAENGGHVRIEMRALPAGPSAIDMAANAAFMIGLSAGLQNTIDDLLPAMPFRYVSENFYRAAREGINAQLIWPALNQNRLAERPLREIGLSLLDVANQGLCSLGVDADDSARMMAVIEHRLATGVNGAVWQLNAMDRLEPRLGKTAALQRLLHCYQRNANANLPVSRWEPAQ